jgi:hypothetical protein
MKEKLVFYLSAKEFGSLQIGLSADLILVQG